MKLSIVTPFPPDISGIGQYGWHMVRGLVQTGRFERILILAPQTAEAGMPTPEIPGTEVRRPWTQDDLRAPARLLRCIRAEDPHLVWFNYGFTAFGRSRLSNMLGMTLPMLVQQRGIASVVTLHEIIESVQLREIGAKNGRLTHLGGALATRMLLEADAVCLTIQAYVDRLKARYKVGNLHHLPHGTFDEPEFLPLPNPHRNILVFGFFAPYKGLPRILAAFELLRRTDPDITLTVAGGDHARYPGYLAEVRDRSGELPGVTWLGQMSEPELRTLFARASVVVLPYTATTGASSVLHRAATYGRPVVASDLPDLRAVAKEENLEVIFVPSHGEEELAQALRQVLADRPRREAIGRHNLQAMTGMTYLATSRRYAALFQDVLDRRLKVTGDASNVKRET